MSNKALSHFESQTTELLHQLSEGQNPFAHLSEEKIQEIHALALFLYRNQHYQNASHFFRLLIASRPSKAKYWKGFGACLQMQQDYEQALNCYISSQYLNQEQPDPYLYLHAADCHFALDQIEAGLNALEAARLIAEEKKDRRILKHVALMRELWSQSS
jgi:type III secretion system low calcium response chaperone LcrH/SycD